MSYPTGGIRARGKAAMAPDRKEMERADDSPDASGTDLSIAGSLGSTEIFPVK